MGGCCSGKKYKINTELLESDISDKKKPILPHPNEKLTKDDFEILKLLGTGSFGKVYLTRSKWSNELFAMKVLTKQFLKQKHQEEHTKTERDLMVSINCPFILNIRYAFQDQTQLYIISEFMQGGDMFFHLHEIGKFTKDRAKFYSIELLLAIEVLHKNNMVYRDLKPENILMDKDGHLKISDFGLSKILDDMNDKIFTLCGTPQYIAPEVIYKQGYDKGIDWWSFGCVFYEMLTGHLPYKIPRNQKLSHKLFEVEVKYPKDFDTNLVDLLKRLLSVDPKNRLGNGTKDAEEIKSHPYYKDVDWNLYLEKKVKPPFIPKLKYADDVKYFDKGFTDESISEANQTPNTIKTPIDFQGFTYMGKSVKNELKNIGDTPETENNENNDNNDNAGYL